jgi:hypothetical protein
MEQDNPYASVAFGMLKELEAIFKAGALSSAVIVTFSFMDAMAWLALEKGREQVKAVDFEQWVDAYLKTDEPAEYQYTGLDVYQARCAISHTYSAQYDRKNKKSPKTFSYWDGGLQRFNPDIDPNLVIISVPLLVADFMGSIISFFDAALKDRELKERIDSRVTKMFRIRASPLDS